ncbi:MAG: hypothetical protein MJY49_05310 [Bacteroidales bacterium]|nr:hypothetical protein [Bacteroidales bacterium]
MKMKSIIRNIIPAIFAIAAVSCSYKQVRTGENTTFRFTYDGLMGTQVTITATPEDYAASFYFDVVEAEEYNQYIASGKTKLDIAQMCVDNMRKYYEYISEKHKDETYKASWMDLWYSGPGNSRLFVNLQPLTDYYVLAACVKPDTYTAVGEVQAERFTTTDIKTNTVPIVLDFLLADTEDGFTYYVRPTYKGRISKELYLSTMVETDVLNAPPYNGDAFLFTRMWYYERKDMIEDYVSSDITRFEPVIQMEKGKRYTVIAAAFNIGEDNTIFMLEFEYEPGMKTDFYKSGIVYMKKD